MPNKRNAQQTNAAFVFRTFRDMGLDPLPNSQARNRFRDGLRIHRPANPGDPITASILNRRLTMDVPKVLADVERVFGDAGVSVTSESDDGGKTALMTFRRLVRTCRTVDGHYAERIIRDTWLVKIGRTTMWLVELPVGADPTALDLFKARRNDDYHVIATAERLPRGTDRAAGWLLSPSQEYSNIFYKHYSVAPDPYPKGPDAQAALVALATPPKEEQ